MLQFLAAILREAFKDKKVTPLVLFIVIGLLYLLFIIASAAGS